MKVNFLILLCLLFACVEPKENIHQDILSENEFAVVLKDIHLAEANFELQKNKGLEKAKNELSNSYTSIYKKHNVSEEKFKETLNFYAQNPEKLEQIYTNVLEQLTKGRSVLDQQ
jgi:hypothetical protein